MRQIKFRFWDGKSMQGVEPQDWRVYMPGQNYMQFTGVLDSQGVEIYEGDILKFVLPKSKNRPNGGTHYHEVFFNPEKGQWYMARYVKTDTLIQPLGQAKDHLVVGNIFENLKLLKRPEAKYLNKNYATGNTA